MAKTEQRSRGRHIEFAEFGKPVCVEKGCIRAVPLHWRYLPLEGNEALTQLKPLLPSEPGVYCFEGRHDAHRNRTVLYIGQSGKDKDPVDEQPVDSALRARIPASLKRLGWADTGKGTHHLFSDVWDIVVRVAKCVPDVITDVESLLIASHSPPFNAQHVRSGASDETRDLLILNAGAKGMLLPVCSGTYYSSEAWPNDYEPSRLGDEPSTE